MAFSVLYIVISHACLLFTIKMEIPEGRTIYLIVSCIVNFIYYVLNEYLLREGMYLWTNEAIKQKQITEWKGSIVSISHI